MLYHFLPLEKAQKATKLLLSDRKASHFFTTADPITESLFCHSKGESSKKPPISGTVSAIMKRSQSH